MSRSGWDNKLSTEPIAFFASRLMFFVFLPYAYCQRSGTGHGQVWVMTMCLGPCRRLICRLVMVETRRSCLFIVSCATITVIVWVEFIVSPADSLGSRTKMTDFGASLRLARTYKSLAGVEVFSPVALATKAIKQLKWILSTPSSLLPPPPPPLLCPPTRRTVAASETHTASLLEFP
ncbi:hypothetical protein GALMADRAFT_269375 [Galerina marginata CBS 339.88]|uniref:Uncharacterized protein n=1 Tax=Galerina marginata (strain CBS 339.88) TaxID=685588 RepID=A0A067SUA1_GALM3|nr:hypothetical protein GALMADRAFT_269375 [Galerina marginata CBS 339.88]